MTAADWNEMHDINLKGTFFMVQTALAVMQPLACMVVLSSPLPSPIR